MEATSQPLPPGKVCPLCRSVYGAEVDFCARDGQALQEAPRLLAGRYLLGERIGAGGMGAVYKAEQLPMGRKVAVKLLREELASDQKLVRRFEREARAASAIDHPAAVVIYDSGQAADGQVFIAMELLEGQSLAELTCSAKLASPESTCY